MKKIIVLFSFFVILYSCSGGSEKKENSDSKGVSNDIVKTDNATKAFDAKGIGKFTQIDMSNKLDEAMAQSGQGIYDLKCSSCHRLNSEKLVGPGWKNVTTRRKPEWIMNFSTNTDEMINKDPQAQALLEECLVRMPNQSLSDDDARHLLEFMRKNDGIK